MKKIGVTIAFFVIIHAVGFVSYSCKYKCDGNVTNLRMDSISGSALLLKGIRAVDTTYKMYMVEEYKGEGIRFDSIGFLIKSYISSVSFNSTRSLYISGAYACDPGVNNDDVHKVIITSDADYNEAFPAGSNLSEIMSLGQEFSVSSTRVNSATVSTYSDSSHLYKFIVSPLKDQVHNLTFIYELSGNRKLQTTIKNLYLKK